MELKLGRPIAFFDLETTGTNPGKDKIVEIAIIKINPDGSEQRLEQLINPEIPIPPATTEFHHISDADVADKPNFKTFAPELVRFIGNADLAGYNSNKFDIPVLVEEFLRADVAFDMKSRRRIDVMNIFYKMEQRTLSAAFKFYCGKKLENAHSAYNDTLATYEILKSMLDKYEATDFEEKDGSISQPIVNDVDKLAKFSSFHEIADFVGQIIFDDQKDECFNFGKYKGKKVKEVFKKEPQYYNWMMESDFPLSTKNLITSIKLREFNQK